MEFPEKDASASAKDPMGPDGICPAPVPPADGEPITAPRVSTPARLIVCAALGAPEPFPAGAATVPAGAEVGVLAAFISPVGVAVTVPPTGLPFPAPSGPVLAWVEPAAIVVTEVGAGPDAEAFPPSVFQLPSPPALAPPAVVGAADGFIVGWISACPAGSPFPLLLPLCWVPADSRMVVVTGIAGIAVTAAFASDAVTATGARIFAWPSADAGVWTLGVAVGTAGAPGFSADDASVPRSADVPLPPASTAAGATTSRTRTIIRARYAGRRAGMVIEYRGAGHLSLFTVTATGPIIPSCFPFQDYGSSYR